MPQIPTYNIRAVRANAILTNAYVAGTVIEDCERYNQLAIYAKYTKGSLTDFRLKVEFSFDGVTYYQHTFESISAGVSTGVAGTFKFAPAGNQNYKILIPIKCHSIKISALGTGTVTNSSLKIDAVVGVQ